MRTVVVVKYFFFKLQSKTIAITSAKYLIMKQTNSSSPTRSGALSSHNNKLPQTTSNYLPTVQLVVCLPTPTALNQTKQPYSNPRIS